MTHTDYFNKCVDHANGRVHEAQLVNMLASIAESLAAIADVLEDQESDRQRSRKAPEEE